MTDDKSLLLHCVFVVIQLLFVRNMISASDTGVVQIPGDSLISCVVQSLAANRNITGVVWCPSQAACYTHTDGNHPPFVGEGEGCTCFEELERGRRQDGFPRTLYSTAGCSTTSRSTNSKSVTSKTSITSKPTSSKSVTSKTSTTSKPTSSKSVTSKTSTTSRPMSSKSDTSKTSTTSKHTLPKSVTSKTSTTSKPALPESVTSKTPTTSASTYVQSTPAPTISTSTNEGWAGWQIVFKAVGGSRRSVWADYNNGGDINGDVPEAKEIMSDLTFRNAEIMDSWEDIAIDQVKVEIFEAGVRRSWFTFDGFGTSIRDWFSRSGLDESSYPRLQELPVIGRGAFFSAEGDEKGKRRFLINRSFVDCVVDCGYLTVVDRPNGNCAWERKMDNPSFLYGQRFESCSKYQTEVGFGDRFIISVKMESDFY